MAARKRLTKAAKVQFLQALAECGVVTEAAQLAKVSTSALYDLRKDNPTFSEKWQDSIEQSTDKLDTECRTRAISGKSDVLLMFLLKGHRASVYNPQPSQALTAPTQALNVIETARQVCLVLEYAKRTLDKDKAITVEVESVDDTSPGP